MSHKILGNYLIKRGKWFHFKRRVPSEYKNLIDQEFIQAPLNTECTQTATERAKHINKMLEDKFLYIAKKGEVTEKQEFKRLLKKLRMGGFVYQKYFNVITEPSSREFINRLAAAPLLQSGTSTTEVDMFMGSVEKPEPRISVSFKDIYEHEALFLSKKTDREVKKWKAPIEKAINNFVAVCGDKTIETINRHDILKFRKWWVEKIMHEERTANSANKDFGYLKKAIRLASDNNMLNMPVDDLFKNINLKE